MKQKLLIILALLALCTAAYAQQNYPVRATVQYTPPYSLFLGDFASPKMIVTLTGQDLLDANCAFKLSISLECQNVKVTTKPSFAPAPLYISGGQTMVLTGADLARYFDIQNLDFRGITAAKYLQDGQLPEGFYRMNVKVLNYKDNRQISNAAFVMFNARMGKPPVLSLPKDKSLVPPSQQTMPIVFSWTPKTVGSFRYIFELWECAVDGIPVQTVVSTVKPLHTYTLTSPMYTFHPSTVNMKPGMQYAWRVTVEDPLNQQKFANQGQSEIFTFTYKRKPEEVTGLRYTNRGLKINWTWDMDPAHTKYYFEYYDPQTGRTIDPVACEYAGFSINMPSTGYHLKARVRAECYGDPTLMSGYTPYLDTYLEAVPTPEYECGKVFPDREITNKELKHAFVPGEIVESKNGDTRYEIISATEKNGYLSGQFFMIMDCWGGAKIRCEFTDTQINTDNVVLETVFHNVPDSTLLVKPETIRKEIEEAFLDAATVLTDFSIKDTVKLDKPYTYLYVNESGKLVAVTDDKGKIKTEDTDISVTGLKENTLVQGKNGEELVVTKKGQVMGKDEFNATGGNGVLLKEYHRKSDSLAQWQINFSQYDKQTYAFDHIGSGNHGIFSSSEYYPQSGSYDFRYKSVECGKTDKVKVEFDTYPQADSVVFKDKYGVTYPIKDRIITFTGVSKADTNFIYAYRGDKKIGKLFLNTYQKKTYKVVLISVNGAKLPNVKDLENYLNKVYRQCADSFKIETRDLQVSGIENFTHGGTKVAGSVWNASQKAVLEAFGEKYEDNTAYLFFIPKAETGGVAGYMPRYYPYGFIYPGAANRTIAHELGHGIAGLEHPFPESQVSGSTQNLMDYREGTELWHFQWDMLQDPARKIFKWWQNEEGAENVEQEITLRQLVFNVFYEQLRRKNNLVYYRQKLDTKQQLNISKLNYNIKYYPAQLIFDGDKPTHIVFEGKEYTLPTLTETVTIQNFNPENPFKNISFFNQMSNYIIYQNPSNQICASFFDFYETEDQTLWPDYILTKGFKDCRCEDNQNVDAQEGNEQDQGLDKIKDILVKLQSFAKDGQEFQYTVNGKAYSLDANGEVEEDVTSDEDVNKGNFSGKNQIVRFNNAAGYWQVSALGLNKDLPVAKGKTADIEDVSKEMLVATQRYFDKYRTEDFETPMTFANTGHFPSGGDIKVDDDASIFSVIAEGGEMTVTFLKTAEFEQKHYLEHTTDQTLISMPGECSGALEGGATAVTDITSLVGMGYDLVVDEESRDAFVQGFSALADEVKEDPVQLFPLLGNIILSGATGLTSDEYKEMVSDDTDPGRAGHLAVKCVASTAITVVEVVFTAGTTKTAKLSQSVSTEAIKTANKGGRFSKILAQKGYRKNKRTLPLRDKINGEFFADYKQKFFDEFDNISYDDFEKLVDNAELIESWKKLSKTNCMDGIRNDVAFLEKISKFENVNFDNIANVFTQDVKDEIVNFIKKADNLTEKQLKLLVGDCSDLMEKTNGKHFKSLIDFEKEFDFLKGNSMHPKIMKSVSLTFAKGLAKERVKDFLIGCFQEMVSHYLIWLGEEYSKWIFTDGYQPKGYFEAKFATQKDIIAYCEAVRKNGLDNVLSFNSKKKLSVYNFICLLYDCVSETKWDDYINLSDIYGKEGEFEKWLKNWIKNCVINTLLGILSDSINNEKAKSEVIEFLKPYINNTYKNFYKDRLNDFYKYWNE